MNDFRSKILSGDEPQDGGLLGKKLPRDRAAGDNLENVRIPREESRSANHRDEDRHRLAAEPQVVAGHRRRKHSVALINLSGGGAMIEAPFRPELWDRVDLELGPAPSDRLECAVRWIKGQRIGLEFAHETRIEAEAEVRSALLREVLDRSFAQALLPSTEAEAPASIPEAAPADPSAPSRRAKPRHPLIWSGTVHFDHESTPVRLRNISAAGALIESSKDFPVAAELHLDLGAAGTLFATVSWARGDQAGLAFRAPFDLGQLARATPELAPARWAKPDYLRDENSESSPWAAEWGRLSLKELNKTLGR